MKRIAILLCLGACSTTPAAPPPLHIANPVPVGVDDSCQAAPHATLVGQDATALERVLIMRPIQLLRPGSIVAQDYRPERINFHIGADNAITHISCG